MKRREKPRASRKTRSNLPGLIEDGADSGEPTDEPERGAALRALKLMRADGLADRAGARRSVRESEGADVIRELRGALVDPDHLGEVRSTLRAALDRLDRIESEARVLADTHDAGLAKPEHVAAIFDALEQQHRIGSALLKLVPIGTAATARRLAALMDSLHEDDSDTRIYRARRLVQSLLRVRKEAPAGTAAAYDPVHLRAAALAVNDARAERLTLNPTDPVGALMGAIEHPKVRRVLDDPGANGGPAKAADEVLRRLAGCDAREAARRLKTRRRSRN